MIANGSTSEARRPLLPRSRFGRTALAVTAAGILAWLVFPTITAAYRETYPVTDSWVMPAILAALITIAAVLNAFTMWRVRDRSILGIVSAAITIPLSLLFIVVLVGSAITGA